jgi:hypothetical protein
VTVLTKIRETNSNPPFKKSSTLINWNGIDNGGCVQGYREGVLEEESGDFVSFADGN